MFLYIDPGTGSSLIQMFVIAFASFLVFFKNIKKFILGFFNTKDDTKDSIDD